MCVRACLLDGLFTRLAVGAPTQNMHVVNVWQTLQMRWIDPVQKIYIHHLRW